MENVIDVSHNGHVNCHNYLTMKNQLQIIPMMTRRNLHPLSLSLPALCANNKIREILFVQAQRVGQLGKYQ